MEKIYTLKVACDGENIITRSSDNLSRLMVCLLSLLEYNFSNAVGEIINNKTGKVVKSCYKNSRQK